MEVKREEKIARETQLNTPSKILPLSGTVTNYNHNNSYIIIHCMLGNHIMIKASDNHMRFALKLLDMLF